MPELVFEVVQEADGGYCAECLTENIFTQGDTWDKLRQNVIEATNAFFFDRPRPARIRLHLVRDEILSVPRNVSGAHLADVLCRRWQYSKVHQAGATLSWRPRSRHTSGSPFQPITLFGSALSALFCEQLRTTRACRGMRSSQRCSRLGRRRCGAGKRGDSASLAR